MIPTKQIIEWLRDHAKCADFYWRRVMLAAADRLEMFSSGTWIPVSERLPESEGKYLCLWRYANEDETTMDVLGWDGTVFPWENFCWKGQHIITHWMPLPEPPMEDEG